MKLIAKLPEQREIFLATPLDPRQIAAMAKHVRRKGGGPGSTEPDDTAGLDYWVVTASMIKLRLPALWTAYQNAAALVAEAVGVPVHCMDTENGVNINMLVGNGSRYERHYDSTPYTMLTYITHQGLHHNGGELVTSAGTVMPFAGAAVAFDGSKVEHEVKPIYGTRDNPVPFRISVPMMFLPEGKTPECNANYLYQ